MNNNAARLLLRLIDTKGCSQRRFAKQVGLQSSLVSRHLSGKRRIQAIHLAAYLDGIKNPTDKGRLLGAWLQDNMNTQIFWLAIAEELPIFVWGSDENGATIFVNQQWLKFTGQTFEEIYGSNDNWTERIHPDDQKAAYARFARATKARKAVRNQYRLRRLDGVYRHIYARGVPRFDALGKYLGYVGFAVDITNFLTLPF